MGPEGIRGGQSGREDQKIFESEQLWRFFRVRLVSCKRSRRVSRGLFAYRGRLGRFLKDKQASSFPCEWVKVQILPAANESNGRVALPTPKPYAYARGIEVGAAGPLQHAGGKHGNGDTVDAGGAYPLPGTSRKGTSGYPLATFRLTYAAFVRVRAGVTPEVWHPPAQGAQDGPFLCAARKRRDETVMTADPGHTKKAVYRLTMPAVGLKKDTGVSAAAERTKAERRGRGAHR